MRCAIGAIPIVQISWVAGKIANGSANFFPFEPDTPAAHEYCSIGRIYASGEIQRLPGQTSLPRCTLDSGQLREQTIDSASANGKSATRLAVWRSGALSLA